MATITAVKSGNWSDTTVWDLGRAPADGDLVLAQSYTITFDVDVNQPNTVLNATSGNFRHSGAGTRNVTANANVGNHAVSGLIQNTSTGTLNFYGAIVGGSGSYAYGAINNAAGTLHVTTVTGGSGSYAYGAINFASGTLHVTTATGGSGSYAYGAINISSGTLHVTTATGGSGNNAYGANNFASGTLHVTTATGGSGSYAHGAINNAAGTLRVQLAVGNDYGPGGTHATANPGVAANNSAGQITSVKSIRYGPHGQSPTAGPVQIVADAALNQATFVTDYSGGTLTLIATASADWPAVANVRSGVSYDNGNKTGTCAVPTAAQTAYGVPVDNTTGTAVLTAAGVTAAVWATALPGAYGAGTAGKLLSDIEAVAPDNKPMVAATGEATANVTHHAGVAVAAADLNGNVPVIVKAWYDTLVPEPNTAGYPDVGTVSNITLQVSQQVRDAMKLAPSGGAAAAGSVDAHLDALALEATAQAVLAVIGAGSGTGLYTDTITNGSAPLDGVRVQLSTDEAGEHRVYETFTNALGVFVLRPDPGTYYRWLDLAGITFEQGVEVEVAAL